MVVYAIQAWYIGYNCIYGNSHCKSYSTDDVAVGYLLERSEILTLSFLILLNVN